MRDFLAYSPLVVASCFAAAIVYAGDPVPADDLPAQKSSPLDNLAPPKPDPFRGWRKFANGDDLSTWYYFPGSVKPLHHAQTGKYLGKYVWAGWRKTDGSYFMAQYQLYCDSGTVATSGAIVADKLGKEDSGQDSPLGYPARPNTFDFILSSVICGQK